MIMKNSALLFDLLKCHGTPGDEDEVRDLMVEKFEELGLEVTHHGNYAVTARFADQWDSKKPTLLLCGHMDSPGFSVEQIKSHKLKLVSMGGIHFKEDEVEAVLKTSTGNHNVKVCQEKSDDDESSFTVAYSGTVKYGDRVCYKADPVIDENGMLKTPFLDNRIACFLLLELAKYFKKDGVGGGELSTEDRPFNVVFGANGTEEMCGFGARVMAEAIKPDMVICLDATYEDKDQKVLMGQGAVVTLSDASVILSCRQRDLLEEIFYDFDVNYQHEVYNYSGTDSRAFPNSGLSCPVFALLLPTTGNHGPEECCDIQDLQSLYDATRFLAERAKEYGLCPGL